MKVGELEMKWMDDLELVTRVSARLDDVLHKTFGTSKRQIRYLYEMESMLNELKTRAEKRVKVDYDGS